MVVQKEALALFAVNLVVCIRRIQELIEALGDPLRPYARLAHIRAQDIQRASMAGVAYLAQGSLATSIPGVQVAFRRPLVERRLEADPGRGRLAALVVEGEGLQTRPIACQKQAEQ
eukprot:CAMPEP_0115578756 /NCGR_PEP_ID=MMETSP0272-20121206/3757_1 /TAXON_ID=71861 /ORGANISM="Scrippsiella trochoidea, Strain CCMP3099" /LENGTH=115 /DNA_ID=CAMNT_0003013619 /DNA_START=18 /DNA_END=365 /DNA_ORIENTATION=+